MAYQLNITNKENYLLAEVSGEFDYTTDHKLFTELIESCFTYNRPKLLLDAINLKGFLSTFQRYNIALSVTNTIRKNFDKGIIQISIVGTEPLIDPDRFGETVATNRGLIVKVTTDMEEALKWLQSE